MCPTRELAVQVTEEIKRLLAHLEKTDVVSIYGGESITKQVRALQKKRPAIVVGTPGRVLDMISRNHLKLKHVAHVVLDEADEMLDMGFRKDIETILNKTSQERQTILFSATMSDSIRQLAERHLHQPAYIKTAADNASAKNIDQHYLEVSNKKRRSALTRLISEQKVNLALIFCNTKRQVDQLARELQKDGLNADALHGGLTQSKRDRVMKGFRTGKIRFLVATDVAARGIDVKNIQVVFNYELPKSLESYVHRIGRTGRADQSGKAFTFVRNNQLAVLKKLERLTQSKLIRVNSSI
jgi:ATP-dependent RNA helicase DeaD